MPKTTQKELTVLFKKFRVLELPQLQKLLHGRSKRSVFRDLREAHSMTSYTHGGRYYTLKKILRFDERGLWQFNDIGFSQYGTLRATIEHWVNHSPMGHTYPELRKFFAIRIDNVLLDLTEKKRIRREKAAREYVYYSVNREQAALQRGRREEQAREREFEISEGVVIEVLAGVIRQSKVCVDLRLLHQQLQQRGINITMRQIAQILELYGVKKTLGSR